ncbi:DUF397 domain-containing protein [Streptomyces sp. PT12]|uniref:DUF397 domain-containing protein n=1 Tax=Streptomyces sp. PT12 TaxID=1510197 RepID=UPI000DE47158|nr:DUF397 domain-containing protein [Streptomyces sp. PT12]RBM24257.1 DUF397 domain-containing protein [Streptomyces sp. PT12]
MVRECLRTAVWRKSSRSSPEGGACVEVASGLPGLVPVRDSKVAGGPVLLNSVGAWDAFMREIHLKG